MSDVEAIGYLNAKIAKLRGLISADTYANMKSALNTIFGELQSAETENGKLRADIETLQREIETLRVAGEALQHEVEALSTVKVDETVMNAVEHVADQLNVVMAVDSGAAESVPTENAAT